MSDPVFWYGIIISGLVGYFASVAANRTDGKIDLVLRKISRPFSEWKDKRNRLLNEQISIIESDLKNYIYFYVYNCTLIVLYTIAVFGVYILSNVIILDKDVYEFYRNVSIFTFDGIYNIFSFGKANYKFKTYIITNLFLYFSMIILCYLVFRLHIISSSVISPKIRKYLELM